MAGYSTCPFNVFNFVQEFINFDNVPSLLYLAYVRRNMGIDEGKMFVRNKLERSFQKLFVGK